MFKINIQPGKMAFTFIELKINGKEHFITFDQKIINRKLAIKSLTYFLKEKSNMR